MSNTEIQVRISTLSEWQKKQEWRYEDAVFLLQAGGFENAEYVKTVVSDIYEEPGYISLG